ncbi:MAG: porin, partial [Vibrio sp.]|nr:porin [Vibrio sp.]
MDKMFKRTLLGAAVAMAAVGSAQAAIPLAGDAVQFYGQAAGFITIASPDKGDESVTATIESRIGFRGVVEFEDFGPNLLWQIEGGNAGHGGFDPDTSWT